nr:TonB-dependent receptor plug domain-containing protein [Saprospiraceae bacterium]
MRKYWHVLLLLFLCLGWNSVAVAQQTLTGTVTDADTGEPLIGASLLVVGTSKGAITDFNGDYELELPKDAAQLEVSYAGYTPQVLALAGQSRIDVQLNPGRLLDEVVVVGYGIQKKKDVSSAIQSIGAEDIQDIPSASFEVAMQGKASGVNITSPSGTPGGAINVNIRGISSISASSQPLFIIDGIPVVSRNNSALNQNIQPVNPLADINPNDIESITILKDASATAMYGSRGANGVVLITTKRGKKGLSVDISSSLALDQVNKLPELQDQYSGGNGGGRFDANGNVVAAGTFGTNTSSV